MLTVVVATLCLVAIALFLSSAGLALLIGEWAVLFWVAIWPIDAVLARLRRRAA